MNSSNPYLSAATELEEAMNRKLEEAYSLAEMYTVCREAKAALEKAEKLNAECKSLIELAKDEIARGGREIRRDFIEGSESLIIKVAEIVRSGAK